MRDKLAVAFSLDEVRSSSVPLKHNPILSNSKMLNNKQMNRRSFLGTCLAASTTVIATKVLAQQNAQEGNRLPPPQRNVLILISDDHGLNQSGCYGNEKIKTPNIDALAANGVRFTNAFTTAASCSSSRSTILTGLHPHQNGQYGLQHRYHNFILQPWVQTLPVLLKKNGYITGIIGKLHVGPAEQLPFDFVVPENNTIMFGRDVKLMAEKAGEFFNQNKDNPFFLLIGYTDPHRQGKGFANQRQYAGIETTVYDPADIIVPYFLPNIPEVREELADMYQAVTRLDSGIGIVIEKLRASGRYEDTLIIYLTDNGIPFPGAKTNVYDSGVHLPMIVCSPNVEKKGIVNNAMVSFADLVPTILDWTRTLGPNYRLAGKSFLPILDRENPEGWNEVYHSQTFHEVTMYYPMRSIRTKDFKYILNLFPELEFPLASDIFGSKSWQAILQRKLKRMGKIKIDNYLHRPAEELFNLKEDPEEINNVAKSSQYQIVLDEMRSKLKVMREITEDPWLILEKNKKFKDYKMLPVRI